MQDHARPRPSAAILLVALASFNLAQAEPVPRSEGIDAVVAVDTLRGPTGAPASERMVLDLLKHVAAMGVDVRVERLSPELVTPGNILAAIDRLDAARLKDRTLFFYYGGHGATDPTWGHLLATPGGDLQRAQLVDRIARKAPRLAVVVTDACSMEASMDGPGVLVPPPPERRAVENLLLQHTGIVDVNGSTYDPARGIRQAAFYHPATGGLFTRAFASMFWPGAEPIAADVPEDAPRFIGGEVTAGYAKRFGPQALWRYDANGDGFLEWMEAEEYLRASLSRLFDDFQEAAASGRLTVRARPQDVELLRTQAGQDPQFFSLAAPSGRSGAPTPEANAAPAARKPRLGVLLEDRTRIAGRYLEIRSVEPNSPAARAVFWKNGARMKRPFPLVQGVVVTAANHRRVTCQADFFRVLDAVPDGEELNLTGYIDRQRRQPFEATVVLDGFR